MDRSIIEQQANAFCKTWQSIDRMYAVYAKSVGLTYMSLTVLEILYAVPEGCTQKRICALSNYTKQSVNMMIKSFLADGYVQLKELPDDRRNKGVWLSPKGKEYARPIIEALWKAEEKAIEVFTAEQREHLLHSMSCYAQSFRQNIEQLMNVQGETEERIEPPLKKDTE